MIALVIASIVGGTYVALVGTLKAFERPLTFPVPVLSMEELSADARELGAREIHVAPEPEVDLYGWRMGSGERLALIFMGNGDSVGGHHRARYEHLMGAGFEVLHVNYRGYPGSTGKPSEKGLRQDALAIWAEALTTHRPEDIVILGTSLGGGVAVGLAAAVEPRALYLESTFRSAAQVGQESFPFVPVKLVMKNRFDSEALAPSLRCPTLVVHGTLDAVIPFDHGEKLASLIPEARFVRIEGVGHNTDLLANAAVWSAFEDLVD